MVKKLIQHITDDLKKQDSNIFIIENNDRFLYRPDVIKEFKDYGVDVITGTNIQQRIQYELREEDVVFVLLTQNENTYLEDIRNNSTAIKFYLVDYLSGYHIPSIIDLRLDVLNELYIQKQIVALTKKETCQVVDAIQNKLSSKPCLKFDLTEFEDTIKAKLNEETINWPVICKIVSNGIINTIDSDQYDDMLIHLKRINKVFQESLKLSYRQLKNSSAVKKPKIVSKILDYINFKYSDSKVALIVIDGLAFWQYQLLKGKISGEKSEEVIYSWLPSITQLSRQAIFRGDSPIKEYVQNPINEAKLWKQFWKSKGFGDYEIEYNYEGNNMPNLQSIKRFALVFKELDDKMHNSTDYKDLLNLTENWIERSKIKSVIKTLLDSGYSIILTTDHGNIQAKGWRGLVGREKLGTNKSGSRSERHIEYTEKWLTKEFIDKNSDLEDLVVMDEQAIYFTNDYSFSNKNSLVSHGGAHILEVLIPFIEIGNEK